MSIDIQDNSEEVLAAFREALLRGLEKCGLAAYYMRKKGALWENRESCKCDCGLDL